MIFIKKEPHQQHMGKPSKFLFQVSIFTLKIQCLVTKGNIVSIGSDDTNCLTSNPAFIDFHLPSNLTCSCKPNWQTHQYQWHQQASTHVLTHFQLMYFPCRLWFGEFWPRTISIVDILASMCGVWFWKGSGLAHYCNAPPISSLNGVN
jgi:hypothetical protein